MNGRRTLLAIVAVVSAPAFANAQPGPWLPAHGEYYSEFSADLSRADSYYDTTGTRRDFALGLQDETRGVFAYNELGWKPWMSFHFQIPMISRTVESTDLRSSATQTGISDLTFGARLRLKTGKSAAALEADWDGPAGYDRDAIPALGPGQQNVGGVLRLGTALGTKGFIQESQGFWYRFESPPNEVRFTADAAYWITPAVLASLQYRGFTTIGGLTSDEAHTHVLGPEVRYRLDDRLDLFVGGSTTVSGKNVNKVNRFFAGLAFKQSHLNRLQGYLGNKRQP
jgi:hypothetical protein